MANALRQIKHIELLALNRVTRQKLSFNKRQPIVAEDYLRLWFVTQADCMLLLNGRMYSLEERTIAVIPPGTQPELNYGTALVCEELQLSIGEIDVLGMQAQVDRLCHGLEVLKLSETRFFGFLVSLTRLRSLIDAGQGLGKAAYARLYDLMVDLVSLGRSSLVEAAFSQTPAVRLAADVKNYIDLHYHENQSLQALAIRFYVSESHLSRVFKAEVGRTLFQYINDLRVRRAAALLRSGQSVSQAMIASGYQTNQHFIHEFKRRMNSTPGRYRMSMAEQKGHSQDPASND